MAKTYENGHIKKRAVIEALEKALGVVTTACKSADVSRSQFYFWVQDDASFKAAVEDISEIAIDFAESQLHKQIQEGNSTATIFYLKTKGKKRGYIESEERRHTFDTEQPLFGPIGGEDEEREQEKGD